MEKTTTRELRITTNVRLRHVAPYNPRFTVSAGPVELIIERGATSHEIAVGAEMAEEWANDNWPNRAGDTPRPDPEPHHCEGVVIATCGECENAWCDKCDPAPGALCHYCHGRGYSTAAVHEVTS